jgi:hypothetical protein
MPEGLGFDEAATTEPLADGLQMVRKAAPQPGEHVVVSDYGFAPLARPSATANPETDDQSTTFRSRKLRKG